jgi:hypothetical protein
LQARQWRSNIAVLVLMGFTLLGASLMHIMGPSSNHTPELQPPVNFVPEMYAAQFACVCVCLVNQHLVVISEMRNGIAVTLVMHNNVACGITSTLPMRPLEIVRVYC